MAIVIGATGSATAHLATTVTIAAFETVAGDNRVLLVTARSDGAVVPTGVTSGGTSLTKIWEAARDPGYSISGWRLIAPAVGTADIVATWADSVGRNQICAVSLTGVHQTTPEGVANSANAYSDPATVDIASAVGELVICQLGHSLAGWTADVGQDVVVNTDDYGDGQEVCSKAGAASVTFTWTLGGDDNWAVAGISFKPAAPAAIPDFTVHDDIRIAF